MMLNPEVQRVAQKQLDVVLHDRLPKLSDRSSLPYIEALLRECYRIHPVVPQGIPHYLDQDDIYEGHFLPKGSIILPNLW